MSFETVKLFEDKVAGFFGAPYAIAVDCCTHGVELCLRHQNISTITVPKRTYISIQQFYGRRIAILLGRLCV